ncbi:MAG TPA: hypothetical protein ENK18_06090 [Deltaproteobacteria bacterium]|nr:hypothetical protein [Deltaproteobacteria bacterium]
MIREDMRFDTRTLKHRLRRKEITPEELEASLAELPDEAEELEETSVRFTSPYEDRHYPKAKE